MFSIKAFSQICEMSEGYVMGCEEGTCLIGNLEADNAAELPEIPPEVIEKVCNNNFLDIIQTDSDISDFIYALESALMEQCDEDFVDEPCPEFLSGLMSYLEKLDILEVDDGNPDIEFLDFADDFVDFSTGDYFSPGGEVATPEVTSGEVEDDSVDLIWYINPSEEFYPPEYVDEKRIEGKGSISIEAELLLNSIELVCNYECPLKSEPSIEALFIDVLKMSGVENLEDNSALYCALLDYYKSCGQLDDIESVRGLIDIIEGEDFILNCPIANQI